MFIGEYQHNLDAKGRIVVPGRFREELHESFILARGLDGCLSIYSLKQWDKMFEEIDKLPTTKKAARQYIRMLTSTATECTLDNQGRILISSKLIALAGLKKECVFVGANKYIELWDQERWEAHNESVESLDELAERINGTV